MSSPAAVIVRPLGLPRRPRCFSNREYEAWTLANLDAAIRHRANDPCIDCTCAFAEEMAFEGRCDGAPGPVVRLVTRDKP